MDCKLVPMDRSHLAGVAALEKLCFAVPWTEAMLAEELYNPAASFIVAEGPAGQVLGYAGLHVVLDEGYIDNVAVRPECRRQGIGDRLLEVFCRFGQAHLAFLTLEVRPSTASRRPAAGRTTTPTPQRTPFSSPAPFPRGRAEDAAA